MQLDSNDRIIFSESPFGEVPVKIGDGNSLFPEYDNLYYQATGYKYPYSWGKKIGWINIIKLPNDSIEVWSDEHPQSDKWSKFALNNKNYIGETIVNYRGRDNDTWKLEKYTFMSFLILQQIILAFWGKYGQRTVNNYWYRNWTGGIGTASMYGLAKTYIITWRVPPKNIYGDRGIMLASGNPTKSPMSMSYLQSINEIPGPQCNFKVFPFGNMGLAWGIRSMARGLNTNSFYPPAPFNERIGRPNDISNADVYTTWKTGYVCDCSPSGLLNWLSDRGINTTDFLTYPPTRKFELDTTERGIEIITPPPPEVILPPPPPEILPPPEVITPPPPEDVPPPEVITPPPPSIVTPPPPEDVVTPEAVPTITIPAVVVETPVEPPPTVAEEMISPQPGTPPAPYTPPPPGTEPPTTSYAPAPTPPPSTADPILDGNEDTIEPPTISSTGSGVATSEMAEVTDLDSTRIPTVTYDLGAWIDARGVGTGLDEVQTTSFDLGQQIPSNDAPPTQPLQNRLEALPEAQFQFIDFSDRILFPIGNLNWGKHIGKMRERKITAPSFPIGNPKYSSNFEKQRKLWYI